MRRRAKKTVAIQWHCAKNVCPIQSSAPHRRLPALQVTSPLCPPVITDASCPPESPPIPVPTLVCLPCSLDVLVPLKALEHPSCASKVIPRQTTDSDRVHEWIRICSLQGPHHARGRDVRRQVGAGHHGLLPDARQDDVQGRQGQLHERLLQVHERRQLVRTQNAQAHSRGHGQGACVKTLSPAPLSPPPHSFSLSPSLPLSPPSLALLLSPPPPSFSLSLSPPLFPFPRPPSLPPPFPFPPSTRPFSIDCRWVPWHASPGAGSRGSQSQASGSVGSWPEWGRTR